MQTNKQLIKHFRKIKKNSFSKKKRRWRRITKLKYFF